MPPITKKTIDQETGNGDREFHEISKHVSSLTDRQKESKQWCGKRGVGDICADIKQC